MVPAVLLLLAAASSPPTGAVDLQSLLECRAEVADYGAWTEANLPPDGPPGAGLRAVASDDPLFAAYVPTQPLTLRGRAVRTLLFDGSGVLAVLADADAEGLAAELDVPVVSRFPNGWFRAERTLRSSVEPLTDDLVTRTAVVRRVWSRSSHPGLTLAGCAYRFEVEDAPVTP